jgi:Regulator of chromosome condensation (RCC1) repeat
MLNPTHLRAAVMVVAVGSSACVPVFRHADDASTVVDAAQPDATGVDGGADGSSVVEDVVVALDGPSSDRDALADGTSEGDATAPPIRAIYTQICAGNGFTCAIVNSRVSCWGRNQYFQTGNGMTGTGRCVDGSSSACPVRMVDAIRNKVALEVSCGAEFACARMNTSEVYCWGRNDFRQLGPNVSNESQSASVVTGLSFATGIAAGAAHACAVTDVGVRCWGDNSRGQLGASSTASMSATPLAVAAFPERAPVIELRAGRHHTIARTDNNVLVGWGTDTHGQLTGGSSVGSNARRLPLPVGPNIGPATTITAAWALTCVATTRDTLCGGSNVAGELGTGELSVSGAPNAFSAMGAARTGALRLIAAGGQEFGGGAIRQHVCGVPEADGQSVRCWGNNRDAQLGTMALGAEQPNPSRLSFAFPSYIVGIAAGTSHSCALTVSRQVYCWGSNSFGESTPLNPMNADPPATVPTPTLVSFP